MLIYFRYILVYVVLSGVSISVFSEDFHNKEEGLELLYEKITRLELEIAELRSELEARTYALDRLEELNQQRYIAIDRRLYELTNPEKDSINIVAPESEVIASSKDLVDSTEYEEFVIHKSALEFFDLGRYSDALQTFNSQIVTYPEGKYAGEAHFWSGEIFLVQQKLADARESYLVIVDRFREHRRYFDALYKLGEIARIKDQIELAKDYFQQVITGNPDTGIAILAIKSLENLEEVSK